MERRKDGRSGSGRSCRAADYANCPELSASPFRSSVNMPQVPPHTHQTSREAEQNPEDDDQGHLFRPKEDQPRERAAAFVAKEQVSPVAQDQRKQPSQQSLEGPLQEERPPYEPVGGANQPHDRDLPGALEEREPDGDADDDDRDRCEGQANDEPTRPVMLRRWSSFCTHSRP